MKSNFVRVMAALACIWVASASAVRADLEITNPKQTGMQPILWTTGNSVGVTFKNIPSGCIGWTVIITEAADDNYQILYHSETNVPTDPQTLQF